METTQKHPETDSSIEAEHSQEQTPEMFQKSLEIFNKYRTVSESEAKQPENTMRFDKHEQGLVVGLRGALNEFITEAREHEESVSIASMFDRLDAAIRAQAENTPEETLDELYLVATKMRYNLQVRFDRKKRTETEQDSSDSDTFQWPKFSFAAAEPLSPASGRAQGRNRSQAGILFKQIMSQPGEQANPDDQQQEGNTPESTGPDINTQATAKIMEYTNGRPFESLDAKEQSKVTKRLGRDFHPDSGTNHDPELYKAMTAQTTRRSQSSNESDTEITSDS